MRLMVTVAVCAALMSGTPAAQTDESTSAPLVKQLVSAMATRQLDSIAVADPDEPGRFVAALAFPEVQVLTVSSRHHAVDYLKMQIAKRQFREVYVLLQEGAPAGRILVHDMGADGLAADGGDNIDIFYEGKDARTMFDGKWESQSLTEQAYRVKFKDADKKYSRLLTLMIDAVRKLPTTTGS